MFLDQLNRYMSKFLNLCEEFDPMNRENPKWALIDLLKSKGINVSVVRDTNMIYIDNGEQTIAVTVEEPENKVADAEEDAETIDASTGNFQVDKEVENLSKKPMLKVGGGNSTMDIMKAKNAVKRRQRIAGKAVKTYDDSTKDLENALATSKRKQSIQVNY